VRTGKLFHTIVVLGASGAGTALGCGQSNSDPAAPGHAGSSNATSGSGGSSAGAPGGSNGAAGGSNAGGSGGVRGEEALYDGGSVVDGSDPISLAGFGGASEPEGVFWPTPCEYAYQFVCDSYVPFAGCRCDPTRPRGPEDCGGVRMTRCSEHSIVDRSAPFDPNDPELGYVDCQCVPDNVDSPEACEGFGQFACNTVRAELRDCHCDPARPATPEACSKPEDFFCEAVDGVDSTHANCYCGSGDIEASCRVETTVYAFECQSYEPRYGCTCRYVGIK
jgi:hypothetical protein